MLAPSAAYQKSRWAQPSHRLESKCEGAGLLAEGLGGESASRLLQAVGRIQFLGVVGLRSPVRLPAVSWGLPAPRGHPPSSNQQQHIRSFSCFESLT